MASILEDLKMLKDMLYLDGVGHKIANVCQVGA
jgi:endonuclease III